MKIFRRRGPCLILLIGLVATACTGASREPPSGEQTTAPGDLEPVKLATDHPRLWIRAADLPRLRASATASNPLYRDALAPVVTGAKRIMDEGHVPKDDSGGPTGTEYPTEMYAQLFAFMSLIDPSESARADYARRARSLLMHAITLAAKGRAEDQPFRYPEFSQNDRSRWQGEAWPLTVDWIYGSLSKSDKALIRKVFLRWIDELKRADMTSHNHPEPVGKTNDPSLVSDRFEIRYSLNNYYTGHLRNIGLMALSFDPSDDPGGALTEDAYRNATGAWLYVVDHVLRNDAKGGFVPEGFEYAPQTLAYLAQFFLAMRTAGRDDAKKYGRQVVMANNRFYDDMVVGFLHSLSPRTVTYSHHGLVYQPAWYGDGQEYFYQDTIPWFGALGLYDQLTGNRKRLNAARWIQVNAVPGGEKAFLDRARNDNVFTNAILYFMLFPLGWEQPTDPHTAVPPTHFAEGLGRLYSRTGWDANAEWFIYNLGWINVDHQHLDGNHFEFYRNGEWLTKERTGYDIASSDYHNTLAIENAPPDHREAGDPRREYWLRGSQWFQESTADGRILAHSVGPDYVYALGDSTSLYNSEHELISDVTHASRSIIWLQPDVIVVYDRATTRSTGLFKRFWLQLPAAASISGKRATMRTPRGQQLFVTALFPSDSVLTAARGTAPEGEPAVGEPMRYTLRVQAPGDPKDVRFLHVLEGADGGALATAVSLVRSTTGTPFVGTRAGDILVLFPVTLGQPFRSVTVTVPRGVTRVLVTGLTKNARYEVAGKRSVAAGIELTVRPGSHLQADAGGVLVFRP